MSELKKINFFDLPRDVLEIIFKMKKEKEKHESLELKKVHLNKFYLNEHITLIKMSLYDYGEDIHGVIIRLNNLRQCEVKTLERLVKRIKKNQKINNIYKSYLNNNKELIKIIQNLKKDLKIF